MIKQKINQPIKKIIIKKPTHTRRKKSPKTDRENLPESSTWSRANDRPPSSLAMTYNTPRVSENRSTYPRWHKPDVTPNSYLCSNCQYWLACQHAPALSILTILLPLSSVHSACLNFPPLLLLYVTLTKDAPTWKLSMEHGRFGTLFKLRLNQIRRDTWFEKIWHKI